MGVNWATGLMRWQPYVEASGKARPLNHLHPFRVRITLPASATSGEIDLDLEVGFSMHTFTRGRCATDAVATIYTNARECRTFDDLRYTLSHRLPEVIKDLPSRKCYHARNDNYLSVADITLQEAPCDYRRFFVLRRWSGKHAGSERPCVRLIVQSAYATPKSRKGREKLIRFQVLLHRTLGLTKGSKKAKAPHECGAPYTGIS